MWLVYFMINNIVFSSILQQNKKKGAAKSNYVELFGSRLCHWPQFAQLRKWLRQPNWRAIKMSHYITWNHARNNNGYTQQDRDTSHFNSRYLLKQVKFFSQKIKESNFLNSSFPGIGMRHWSVKQAFVRPSHEQGESGLGCFFYFFRPSLKVLHSGLVTKTAQTLQLKGAQLV